MIALKKAASPQPFFYEIIAKQIAPIILSDYICML